MDEEAVIQFSAITSATPAQAERYLQLTDGNLEQAIQLYFEDPSLGSVQQPTTTTASPPQQATTRLPEARDRYAGREIIEIDSDDDSDVQMLDEVPRRAETADDAEMARRLQEEMYGGVRSEDEDIRAPMARTRETLIGGPTYDDVDDGEISALVQQQILGRQRRTNGRAGIFNQRDTQAAVWENESSAQNQILSFATGGASERSNKAHTLAEMYRPPFEIISRLSFDEARDEGKATEKWILVNVQDPSIFDCQVLNRDLWKNKDIMAAIKENFIFLQYAKEDPRGANYINYYFQASLNNQNAYPHIGIVDPRTGEQVKVWSGHPPPEASEFLIQLYDFLDRYSLDPEGKNPVAKRKPERKPELDIDRMTEEQMLEMALQNSLAEKPDSLKPAHDDPDELTKSITLDKGKGKAPDPETNGSAASPWSRIANDCVHTEPPNDPKTTTRIQFRYSGGRIVRRFRLDDAIMRIYEWLKASPLEGKYGAEFELIFMGRNLIEDLHETIEGAGLKNGSVMVEFIGGEDE